MPLSYRMVLAILVEYISVMGSFDIHTLQRHWSVSVWRFDIVRL